MEMDNRCMHTKQMEQSLTMISAKIAGAVELSQRAKEMTASSETLLINAQQELEELYVSLGEIEESRFKQDLK